MADHTQQRTPAFATSPGLVKGGFTGRRSRSSYSSSSLPVPSSNHNFLSSPLCGSTRLRLLLSSTKNGSSQRSLLPRPSGASSFFPMGESPCFTAGTKNVSPCHNRRTSNGHSPLFTLSGHGEGEGGFFARSQQQQQRPKPKPKSFNSNDSVPPRTFSNSHPFRHHPPSSAVEPSTDRSLSSSRVEDGDVSSGGDRGRGRRRAAGVNGMESNAAQFTSSSYQNNNNNNNEHFGGITNGGAPQGKGGTGRGMARARGGRGRNTTAGRGRFGSGVHAGRSRSGGNLLSVFSPLNDQLDRARGPREIATAAMRVLDAGDEAGWNGVRFSELRVGKV